MAPLLIIDGDNLAHRAYHSTPKSVVGKDGQPINAIVGFFSMLLNVVASQQPRGVFVAWDTLGVDTYRSKLWPAYQGGRVFEKELVEQLNQLPDLCKACGLGTGKKAGYEADDIIASAATKEVERGGTCLILTTDRDTYQLLSDSVTMLSPRKGARELERIGPREVVERLGVLPEQVPDFKALSGDASDKIPGLRGIGPKSAASLLLKHGTLERALEALCRPDETDIALAFREVATMKPEVEVELPDEPDWKRGAGALRAIGAERLAERLASTVCK